MNNWIAIDFGTSTVKAAYLDTDGEPKAMELGSDRDTIPSIFHLSEEGELSFGEKAEEIGEEDPKGNIEFLKRKLLKTLYKWYIRIPKWLGKTGRNERSAGDLQQEFLVELFKYIRKHAEDRIHIFQGKPPTAVCLTVTNCYKPAEKDLLHEAAEEAGFEEIEYVLEPLAAAQMWREEADVRHNLAVVLDCGGGTTDWTYVRRASDGDFQLQPKFTGSVEKGGSDVDEALYTEVQGQLGNRRENKRHLMRKVRKWKEDYSNNYPVDFEVGNTPIALTPSDLQATIDTAYIKPVIKELKTSIEKLKKELKEELGEEKLPVLLVGGSHRLKGLKEAVDKQLGCEPFLSEHEITGPALGAVLSIQGVEPPQPIDPPIRPPQPIDPPDNRRFEAAHHCRDVAKLIGEKQEKEITLASGRTVAPGLRMIEPATALNERADRLENGSLRLAVVGTRNRGKSTLINALLSEDLLPTSHAPTTAIITQIVDGKKTKVTLVEKNGKKRTIPRKKFVEKGVMTSEDKVPQEFVNVAYAVLESDTCPLCKAGLQLVDTLGFDSTAENEEITRKYLNEVDAVVLVLSSENTFDKTDIKFMNEVRRRGDSGLNHVFFFINDRSVSEDTKLEILENARERLKPELGEELLERRLFFSNARHALEGRAESGKKDLTALPDFEQEIERFLKSPDRVNVILDTAVRDVLNPAIDAARSRMKVHKELLTKSQEDLETTIRDFNDKRPQLEEKATSIHSTFNGFIKKIADTIAKEAISTRNDLIGGGKWAGLNIGGNTAAYYKKATSSERAQLSNTIQSNIRAYIKKEVSDVDFKEVYDQCRALSDTLEEEVISFVKELNRNEAPWFIANLHKLLSKCQKRVIQRIISAYSLQQDKIGGIVRDTLSDIGWWRRFRNKSKKTETLRRKNVKEAIRDKLRFQFEMQEKALRREIHELIREVFKDPSDKLQEDLWSELERRERVLTDIRKKKRSGIDAEKAELDRLETINICLDKAFDAICQLAYGRVLTPQEQQDMFRKK